MQKKQQITLLKNICYQPQQQLKRILYKYLLTKYDKVYNDEFFIMAEGTIPIALVAHMDTVNSEPPHDIYFDKEQQVMWSPQLLGADDRAGIFAIIQIIEAGYRPHIIFTTDEELGCVGSNLLVIKHSTAPFDLKYIIQLDRQGQRDCVFYGLDNPDFVKYVEKFGFEEDFGTFSDISVIAPTWKIAAVNLSIGYENEHTNIELLHLNWMFATIRQVTKMLQDADSAEYFKYTPRYTSLSLTPLSPY